MLQIVFSNEAFIHFSSVFFISKMYKLKHETFKTCIICLEISHGCNPTINECQIAETFEFLIQ